MSRPPQLGILRTPRQGRAVTTSVVLVLRHVAVPALTPVPFDRATLSPAVLAAACTAAFLEDQLGTAGGWPFPSTSDGASAPVTPADPGLPPADAPALTRTELE